MTQSNKKKLKQIDLMWQQNTKICEIKIMQEKKQLERSKNTFASISHGQRLSLVRVESLVKVAATLSR